MAFFSGNLMKWLVVKLEKYLFYFTLIVNVQYLEEGNSMKKLTVIACLSTLLAAPIAAQANWKTNWLVGASGGYNWYEGDFDVTIDIPGGPVSFDDTRDASSKGWLWGIFGGYQAMCDGWLIGAELNVDWENNNHTQNHLLVAGASSFNATTTFDRDATIGLTARLGYEINCWLLPYVRLGIETSRDEVDVTIGSTTTPALAYSASGSNRSWRFVGGLGVELPVPACDGLSVRAEYDYHSRGTGLDHNGDWTGVVGNSSTNHHSHTNTAKASVVYNFDI
jgi:opacity protein-like surface antigen